MHLRVAVVDDQPVFRLGLSHLLIELQHPRGMLELGNADELEARRLRAEDIGLVLLSMNGPVASGLDELARVHRAVPELSSIVLPTHCHPNIVDQCRKIGASGCLSKTSSESTLRAAVKTVMSGGTWFKSQERTAGSKDAALALQMAELRVGRDS